jgi:serine protease Do
MIRLTLQTLLVLISASALWIPTPCLADYEDLQARQKLLEESLARVQPAVVGVTDGIGFGSGVVVSGDGFVLTASHVVENTRPFSRRRQRPMRVIFQDGQEYQCEVLGKNRSADAAMLKITEPPKDADEFPHVELGRTSTLNRGDWCFALGHPGGFRRERPAPVRFGRVLSVGDLTVVSDNAIVLGDSGGPLFDIHGRLIGIHSMITEVIVENRHVAIDVWHRDWDRLEAGESWGRLRAFDNELAESDFFGVGLRWKHFVPEVSRVINDGPADRAGIRPGDTLKTIDGQRFADRLELGTLLAQMEENKEIEVSLERNQQLQSFTLTTGARPEGSDRLPRDDDSGEPSAEDREAQQELRNQLSFNRQIGPFEKRAASVTSEFIPAVQASRQSVVEIREFGRTLAMGAIMSDDGYILTKASELRRTVEPDCILADGRRRKFRTVSTNAAFDLALLKIDLDGLTPVTWADSDDVQPGRIVITTDSRGTPLLPGVVSVATRQLATSSKPFLGIVPQTQGARVVVVDLVPGGAAERSGIKERDEILSIDGTEMNSAGQLIRHLGRYEPGDSIDVRILRDDLIRTIHVDLTARFVSESQDVLLFERYGKVDSLGKYASLHNSGFPEALQHDTDLYPRQCGGPLLDVSGKAIGLNIARSARITSYAIPASAVLRVYKQLREQDKSETL